MRVAVDRHDPVGERLALIMEGTGAATWEFHVPSGEAEFSEGWASLLGYRLEELKPCSLSTWVRLTHPDDIGAAQDMLARHLAGELPYYDVRFRMRHREDRWIWILARGRIVSRLPDGRAERMFGIHLDITEQQESIETARAQSDLLSRLTEELPGVLFTLARQTDGRFHYLYFSDAAERIFGLKAQDILQDARVLWRMGDPATASARLEALSASAQDLSTYEEVIRYQHPQDPSHWVSVEVRARPQRLADGTVLWYGHAFDVTARLKVERDLDEQRKLLLNLSSQLPGVLYELHRNPSGRFEFRFIAATSQSLFGLTPQAIMEDAGALRNLVHPEDRAKREMAVARSAAELSPYSSVYRLVLPGRAPPANVIWVESTARVAALPDGTVVWYGYIEDVSDAVHLQNRLKETTADQSATLAALPDLLMEVDAAGVISRIHAPFSQRLIDQPDTLVGQSLNHALGQDAAAVWLRCKSQAVTQGLSEHVEILLRGHEGAPLWIDMVCSSKFDASGAHRFIVLFRDVTQKRAATEALERVAYIDTLTGLGNRSFLTQQLAHALLRMAELQHYGGLILLDFDHFKQINDTKGHEAGDALLQQVGERLRGLVGNEDRQGGQPLAIVRTGGDEFALLIQDLGERKPQAIGALAAWTDRVQQLLGAPFDIHGQSQALHCSLGVTLLDGGGAPPDFLKQADIALYEAKAAGRNCYRIFDAAMSERTATRYALLDELRAPSLFEQLQVWYQPLVDRHETTTGYEALLRWVHPERGMVSPALFIPLAEESSLMVEIGNWVLDSGGRQLAEWAGHPDSAAWSLAINVSARQVQHPDFVQHVLTVVERHRISPGRMKLELTESMLLEDVEDTILKMDQLAQRGIRFALDDFGTGYSSLAYISRLPLSQLKIDRAFVSQMTSDRNSAEIARVIVQLARALRLMVVAEGVESREQFEALKELGCDRFQGFLFGSPQPAPAPPSPA